jgi:hypothetical protein
LTSPDVPIVSCAAVGPSVAVVLSAVNFHGVLFPGIPAVTGLLLLLASLLLLAYLLLLNFPLLLVILLLLSPSSCCSITI